MNQHLSTSAIQRLEHSGEQLRAAQSLGHVSDAHRNARRNVTTHAIDNVTPDILADRDDGVFVELSDKASGGYKVTVTIADVAAQVPLNSPLARVAHELAFTRYRPDELGGNDPMFPHDLEARMSLEDGQERLGLSVVMELDEHFNLTHTAFEPVIAEPDNVDYAMAGERAKTDAQFKHLHEVAEGIFKGTFGGNFQLLRDAAPMPKHENDDTTIESSMMVASYMLLANHAVASFFEKSGLPFVYRNFDGTHQGPNGMDRAFYDTQFTAHTELEKAGLNGAYCHFTSPIRRGPDYYNGHMVHYACEVKNKIQERVWAGTFQEIDHDAEHLLWHQMPAILGALYAAQQSPEDEEAQLALKHQLRKAVNLLCRNDPPPSPEIYEPLGMTEWPERNVDHEYHELLKLTPPLTSSRLKEAVKEINTLCDQERDALDSPEMRQFQRHEERLSVVNSYAQGRLQQMSPREFSAAIRNCALTGELPEKVEAEALKRYKGDDSTYKKAVDAMHILVAARGAEGDGWQRLRKAMIRSVRNDPAAVWNALSLSAYLGYLKDEELPVERDDIVIPTPPRADGREGNVIRGAIVHTADERSAPFCSIGHDMRSAMSHARYSFLEHVAFDDLHPLDEVAVPNLLYAGLDDEGLNREKMLRDLVQENGGEVISEYREPKSGQSEHMIWFRVRGGVFGEGIDATGYGEDKDAATRSALRKILRKSVFKDTVKTYTSAETYRFLNPDIVLAEDVEKRGWNMRVQADGVSKRGHYRYTALVLIYTDLKPPQIESESGLVQYTGEGENKAKAIHDACIHALRETPGLSLPQPPEELGRSWAGDAATRHGEAESRALDDTPAPHVLMDNMAQHELFDTGLRGGKCL